MPLSAHEQRILAGVEEELREKDPELADLFTRCPPPTARHGYPVSPAGLGLLVVVLLALVVLVHPLAAAWGAAGVVITIALAMLVGVHLARWSARCVLYRRFGPDAHTDHPHRED